jgi:hypothetical protein
MNTAIKEHTKSVCPKCLKKGKVNVINADRIEEKGKIYMIKKCRTHGRFKEILFDDSKLYRKYMNYFCTGDGVSNSKPSRKGCPHDCGLCENHKTQSVLTNLFVTNRCDLRCEYCFANSGAEGFVYEPSLHQLRKQLMQVRSEQPVPGKALQLSLDGNEKILLKDEQGKLRYEKIGKFVDKHMKNPKKLKEPIEHERDTVSDWKVLSLDSELKSTFKEIKEIIRHEVDEDIFEIITENNKKIKTTGSHSVFTVSENGELVAKPVSNLEAGEELVQCLNIPESEKINEINLIESLINSPVENKIRIYPNKQEISKVEKLIGRRIGETVGLHEVKNHLDEFEFETIAHYNSKKEKVLPVNMEITPELCRLLGYYTGEGRCYRSGIIFTFGGHEKEMIDDAVNCIRSVLGETNIRVKEIHGGSATQIYVEGYLYKTLFENILKAGRNSRTKKIPWIIYNVHEDLKKEYLKAYFRCDGSVRTRKSGCEIDFHTVSEELASDLLLLNQQLDITPRISTSKSKGHMNKVTGNYVKPSKKYTIIIDGKEELHKALWLLKDEDISKFKKYIDVMERHVPKRFRISSLDLKHFWNTRNKFSDQKMRGLLTRIKRDKSISKHNLAMITDYCKENQIDFNKNFNDISHSDLGFLKIKEIRKIKPSSKYVYDVSVDGQQFFSGLGMLLAHNTGGEPLMRDDLIDIIKMAKKLGFVHVQVNTNAIRIAKHPQLARELREAGVNTIYMSFDGVTKATNPLLFENKKAIQAFRKVGMGVVLVPTVINNINDHELGEIIKFATENIDIIRGVNFQPVSFVGRIDKLTPRQRNKSRITFSEMIRKVENQLKDIKVEDWYPVPFVLPISKLVQNLKGEPQVEFTCSPSCGGATYVFAEAGKIIPITQFLDVEGLMAFIEEQSKKKRFLKKLRIGSAVAKNISKFIDKEKAPKSFNLLELIKETILGGNYKKLGKFHHNSLYLGSMWFQDSWNLDLERLERCAIHYATPEGIIPFCAYNGLNYGTQIRKKHSITFKEWEKQTGQKLKDDLWDGLYSDKKAKIRTF